MRIPGVEREDSVLGDDLCHLISNATLRKIHQRLRTNRCPILLAMAADNYRGGPLQRSLISSVITLSLSASVVCIILTGFCHLPPLYASASFLSPRLCTHTRRESLQIKQEPELPVKPGLRGSVDDSVMSHCVN